MVQQLSQRKIAEGVLSSNPDKEHPQMGINKATPKTGRYCQTNIEIVLRSHFQI